jgi:ABC transporter
VSDSVASVEIRRDAAFVGEDKPLFDYMTVQDAIRFTAAFYPRWRQDLEQHYLATFGLSPAMKVKTLSRGMRTGLALLLALCRNARLLILDEPTSGLDPAMSEQVLQALTELLALAVIPSLLIPLLSPAVGEHYGLGETAVHSLSLFLGGSLFFSLAFLLSAVFDDFWRPMLITCAIALSQTLVGALAGLPFSEMLRVMSAESYFRMKQVPWLGLGLAVTTGLLMLSAAVAIVERRDF